jgi:hypothetical protein
MSAPTKSPEELSANFKRQMIETARRCVAMRRRFPGAVCHWRRAARTGSSSGLALVFILHPGKEPVTEVWPYSRIEELATGVSDDEAFAELIRHNDADLGEGEPDGCC